MSNSYSTPSLDLKPIARDIFDYALHECSIERAIDRKLRFIANPSEPELIIDEKQQFNLGSMKYVRIVAAGKAATAMLTALLPRLPLPASCDLQGVLIAPAPPLNLPSTIQFFAGSHPHPTKASFDGASAALTMLKRIEESVAKDTLCLFLISGGASSMMELPLDPTITVADTARFHKALIHSGATIVEMNCVRKHFSAIKGGRLALAAGNTPQLTLLVSDVPPAQLDALGSGPTLPDTTTIAQCKAILEKYNLLPAFPTSIQHFFHDAALPETPKPGQINGMATILIDSDDLADAARARAEQLGFQAFIDNTCDDWPYDSAADYLLERLRTLRREHQKVCLVSTGEVTVKLPPSNPPSHQASIGGRNQHLALYIATQLRTEDHPIAVLSAGTDGIDGNSNAAGAVVDPSTIESISSPQGNTDPQSIRNREAASAIDSLARFDSSTWLHAAGATIITGPTGHNLRDLRILLTE